MLLDAALQTLAAVPDPSNGDPATATLVNFGPDPNNKFVTTYFRRSFVVPWNAIITNLNFRLACADGAVVWLNGQEVYRANLPAGPLTYTNLALSARSAYTSQIFYPTNIAAAGLPVGTNLIAVEVHQSSVTNSTFGFDLELIGSGDLLPTPSLSIAPAGTNVVMRALLGSPTTFTNPIWWLFNGTNVLRAGTNTATSVLTLFTNDLVLTNVSAEQSGYYTFLLSNGITSVFGGVQAGIAVPFDRTHWRGLQVACRRSGESRLA